MVDGVHGHMMGHVVRHVVVEHNNGLEDVTILHLPVKEMNVMADMSKEKDAILAIIVLVRLYSIISCVYMCVCNNIFEREKEIPQ